MKKLVGYNKHIIFLISVYFTGILFLFVYRLLLFLLNIDLYYALPDDRVLLVLQAFVMGLRFDTVISCYILFIPFLLLGFLSKTKRLYKIISIYLTLFYGLTFLVCAIDIPFFKQYVTRFNTMVFGFEGDAGFILSMVFEEFSYWIHLSHVIIFSILFGILIFYYKKKTLAITNEIKPDKKIVYLFRIPIFILFGILLFVGMRGRLEQKSPIKVGTAFFSNYNFINQLGLNPVFTLIRSYLDDKKPENNAIKLMDEKLALKNVRSYFNTQKNGFISPIARKIRATANPQKHNVVLIIMESMSDEKTSIPGGQGLTPVLDSLKKISYNFNSIYTAGIHTYNGIYSSITGFPALMKQHLLNRISPESYISLPAILDKDGYHTMYFTTHDDQFDNVGGFLKANGMKEIVSQKNYPSDKVQSTLGVGDDFMFEYSVSLLTKTSTSTPFLAVYMTSSDHGPYTIPSDVGFISKRGKNEKQCATEYADWSIGKFLRLSSAKEWYKNTIFVFIADHGFTYHPTYEMPLSYHHSPLIIFAPTILKEPKSIDAIGGQIDLLPTIMGLLGKAYTNNTFGIDLLNEKRPYIYFSADDKIGVLDDQFFLIIKSDKTEALYKYRLNDINDYKKLYKAKTDSMRNYAFSMLQTAQWFVSSGKVGKSGLK